MTQTLHHLHHLLAVYGYWLMALGAIIEGETFLVAGGIAASQGMFHLPGLIALALVGSFVHDCFFFFLGRYAGNGILNKRPNWRKKSERVLKLFDRYGIWLIIFLRYAYGLRTMIPAVMGMSPISNAKFIFFDIIGGILWSCTFILLGYFIGNAAQKVLSNFEFYEAYVGYSAVIFVLAVCLIGVIWWLIRRRWPKRPS